MNYYVFRVNYDKHYSKIREEVKRGRLRQGWGAEGMTCLQSRESFIGAWKKVWGKNDATEQYMIGKWNMLQIISEMQEGDRIVIPKMSLDDREHWNCFTIVERTADPYYFEPLDDSGDFGHIVPVKTIATFTYGHDHKSREVCAKFKAYRRPINRVYSENFWAAVEALIEECQENPEACGYDDMNSLEALSAAPLEGKKTYLQQIIDQINQWAPDQLEKLIAELFEKHGYIKKGNNRFDRKGGDIDLIFDCFVPNTLMSDLLACGQDIRLPEIRVQAKNKKGIDYSAQKGVEQLAEMNKKEESSKNGTGDEKDAQPVINVLINTTMEFIEGAKEAAEKKNIVLIGGMEFAALLVKYGLDII